MLRPTPCGTRRALPLVVCLATLLGWCDMGRCAEPATRPNVIVLLTDDQGYGDLSSHGNPVLKTPHLDKLHGESVRFTDFHVEPMCTPTRAELMTGVDALRTGAMNVSSGRTLLRRDLPTMADIFAASGYRTGMFGKWHLGDAYPYRPKDRGFQDTVCFRSSYIGSAADEWNNDYFNDRYRFDDQPRRVDGYCTDVFFDNALDWIKQRGDKGEPFFAYLPTNAPHGPLLVPKRYRKRYEQMLADQKMNEQQRERLARYFGMIANIDDNLGRLEKVLEETGLRDNTILVFMSDNGGTAGVPFYNAGMRGHKVQLWEGGHRVPCFVRWLSGGIGGGRDVDQLTECQDLLPTLIELCGLKTPPGAKFDGTSLAGLLRGEEAKSLPDRTLVVQFSRMPIRKTVARPQKDDATVMWRKWRLLRGKELYDLASDPHQDKNVIEEHPEIAKRLQKHYDAWWAEIEPTLGTFQPSVIGSDQQNPTRLCACEWADVFLDQMGQVRRGSKINGLWHVEVAQPGRYELALCRWPREVSVPMTKSTPPHQGEDCFFGPGKALPIAKARLRVGEHDLEKEVSPTDHEATFTVTMPKGRTTIETWFYNKHGKELCGAYYVYVKRLQK
ncbi:MAG: arylsulfatase [Pirellulales bacterium]|nr:arylsulfatase [Pirellulales bacterium]